MNFQWKKASPRGSGFPLLLPGLLQLQFARLIFAVDFDQGRAFADFEAANQKAGVANGDFECFTGAEGLIVYCGEPTVRGA